MGNGHQGTFSLEFDPNVIAQKKTEGYDYQSMLDRVDRVYVVMTPATEGMHFGHFKEPDSQVEFRMQMTFVLPP